VSGALTGLSLVLARLLLAIAVAVALLPLDGTWVHAVSVFRGDHWAGDTSPF
jgi:hypothetical protein